MPNTRKITNLSSDDLAFINLNDCPTTYQGSELLYCQVNNTGTGLQFASSSGTGVTKFTELDDTPNTYAGSAGYNVQVNGGGTGLTFQPFVPSVTQFIQCSDTPTTYTGSQPYDIVNINSTTNGVRFLAPSTISKFTTNILDMKDYLGSTVSHPPGILQSNGTNGFNITNGSNNDVLQIVSGAPAWVPFSSAQIPDPLEINNINERTVDTGVTLNNNVTVFNGTKNGIQFENNTLNVFGNIPKQMNTYISGSYTAQYVDSQTLLSIGTTTIYFNKIGGMCFCTVGPVSTNALLNNSSYVVLSNVVQNGPFIPKNAVDSNFGTVVWKSSTDTVYRNDARIFYDASSRLFRLESLNRSDGGYNAGGKNFTTGQWSFCWLGQDD
jgi:hypothetical protein